MEKRGKYGKWSQKELQLAVNAFLNGGFGLNEAARVYNIPKATLKRHIDNKNKVANADIKKFGKCTTLPKEIEGELTKHILKLEEMMFGLTILDIRKLAFEIAERNNIPHTFNKQQKLAGKKLYYAFMHSHTNLTLRQPESTSIARAKGFNRENVNHFFDVLEKIHAEHKLDATRIFNVDESGFSTVQKKSQKIVGQKGKKQIGAISSGERGTNTTMVCCVSASGQFIPPMIIYKRMRMAPELKLGAPAGSLVEISESGYINSELFTKWLQHFINVVKPTTDRKVLLVLDGHSTHSKNLDALLLARENGVILLQLPGHTTHRLQPLDVSFFKPMETYYTQAMERWLRTNPGMKVTVFQISELLSEAYGKAAYIQTAVNGFKATGIWPIDRNVFTDVHFAAASNLNQNMEQNVADHQMAIGDTLNEVSAWKEPDSHDNIDWNGGIGEVDETNSEDEGNNGCAQIWLNKRIQRRENVKRNLAMLESNFCDPGPSTSGHRNGEQFGSKKSNLNVSIEELSPIPVPVKKQKQSRGAQKAEELTSTAYKEDLISKKKKVPTKTQRGKGKQKKPQVTIKKQIHKKGKKQEDKWYCYLCRKEEERDMIQCMECLTWVHADCANVSPLRNFFFCSKCLNDGFKNM